MDIIHYSVNRDLINLKVLTNQIVLFISDVVVFKLAHAKLSKAQ